jgi:hypothetical protein
MRWNL